MEGERISTELQIQTEPHSTENELDNILSLFGNKFGKYQLKNALFVCIPVIISSIYMLSYAFTSKNLDYRCQISGCDSEQPEYNSSWLPNAVPFNNEKPSLCTRYRRISNSSTCSNETFDHSVTQTCNNFVFATEETTILNDFNLECENNLWKLTIVGTISGSGQIISLPIAGYISDKFGRRTILLGGLITSSILGNLRSISPTYPWFLSFEFLDQLVGSSAYSAGFVLGAELVPPNQRTLMCTFIFICDAIGESILGAVAWLTKSWRLLLRCVYTPGFILIAFFWLTPESLTWLFAKGRLETVKSMLEKAMKTNNIRIPEEMITKLNTQISTNSKTNLNNNSMISIFKSRILFLRLVNCSFCLLTVNLVFFGLMLRSVAIAGNEYLNFILMSLIEIPAHILNCVLVQKVGRRYMLCGSLLLCGSASVVFIFLPEDIHWLQLVIFLIGKFGVTIAFAVSFIFPAEVFPTPIRNSAVGIIAMIGMFGTIAAPQMALAAEIIESLPYIIFGCLSFSSALLALLLPETLNKKLPDTVEEAENINKQR